MSQVNQTLKASLPYLLGGATLACLCTKRATSYLGTSPTPLIFNALVAGGTDYFLKDQLSSIQKLALTLLGGIVVSQGLGKVVKNFNMPVKASLIASTAQCFAYLFTRSIQGSRCTQMQTDAASPLSLRLEASFDPEDRSSYYLCLTLTPKIAESRQGKTFTDWTFLIDQSGSMYSGSLITGMQQVNDSMKKFFKHISTDPNSSHKVRIISYSSETKVYADLNFKRLQNSFDCQRHAPVYPSGTCVQPALEAMTSALNKTKANKTCVVFLTDGAFHDAPQQELLTKIKKAWQDKGAVVSLIGLTARHSAESLLQMAEESPAHYYYVRDANPIKETSEAYKSGRRTMLQAIQETFKASDKLVATHLTTQWAIPQGSSCTHITAQMQGSLPPQHNAPTQHYFKLQSSEGGWSSLSPTSQVTLTVKGKNQNGVPMSLFQTISLGDTLNRDIIAKGLLEESKQQLLEAVRAFSQSKNTQQLQAALEPLNTRLSVYKQDPNIDLFLGELNTKYLTPLQNGQNLPSDVLAQAAAFSAQGGGASSGIIGTSSTSTSSPIIAEMTGGVSGLLPTSRNREAHLPLVQRALLALNNQVRVGTATLRTQLEEKEGIQLPTGMKEMPTGKGEILRFSPAPNVNGLYDVEFSNIPAIKEFERKHNMQFKFQAKASNPITLPRETMEKLGLPTCQEAISKKLAPVDIQDQTTYFRWIYPAENITRDLAIAIRKELPAYAEGILLGWFQYDLGLYSHSSNPRENTYEYKDGAMCNATQAVEDVDGMSRICLALRAVDMGRITEHYLPFGTMQTLSQIGKQRVETYPSFKDITLESLLKNGFKKFAWVNPIETDFIQSIRNNVATPVPSDWAVNGLFIYLQEKVAGQVNALAMPVITAQEQTRNLHGKYITHLSLTEEPVAVEQETCCLCLTATPTLEHRISDQVSHAKQCQDCYNSWQRSCPECRRSADARENPYRATPIPASPLVTPSQFPPRIELFIEKLEIDLTYSDWITRLINDQNFRSPWIKIPHALQSKFPGQTEFSFFFPPATKDLGLIWKYVDIPKALKGLIQTALEQQAPTTFNIEGQSSPDTTEDLEKLNILVEALLISGAFITRNENDQHSVFPILVENTSSSQSITLIKTNSPNGNAHHQRHLTSLIKKLTTNQKKGQQGEERTDEPALGHVTVESLRVAKYFALSFDGTAFLYSLRDQANTCVSLEIS